MRTYRTCGIMLLYGGYYMARIKTNKYPNTQSYCIIEDYKRNGKRTTRVVENIGNYQKVSILAKEQGIDVDTWLDNYLNDYRKRNDQ